MKTRRRAQLVTGIVGVVALLSALLGPFAAAAGPMPPQMPTAEEMQALSAQVEATLSRVREIQNRLDVVLRDFEAEQHRLEDISGEVIKAQSRQTAVEAELARSRQILNQRASSVYRAEKIGLINVMLTARNYREFVSAFDLMETTAKKDVELILRAQSLKAEADRGVAELSERKSSQQRLVGDLSRRSRQVDASLREVAREYQSIKAELEKRKSGFAFPVQVPYSYGDSWGAPRMEGTSYYHRHEGTDIFALAGTPVVSVVDGVLENVGNAPLGGIKLWVRSPGDRWSYYYAHLSGYAPGVANGKRVKKGEVLGYVGNTGNARGTPAHLHFETHVPSGPATNPYPILRRADPLVKK